MKSSAYLLFYRQPSYVGLHPLFLQKNIEPHSMVFQKSSPFVNKGVHTMSIAQTNRKQNASNWEDFKNK